MNWEYYRLSVDGPNVETALQDLGQHGWELVAVIPETKIFYGFQCFFKRPLPEAAPIPAADRSGEPKRLEKFASVRSAHRIRSPREDESSESVPRISWKR